MSAMGAEDESGTVTVREEGACAEVKAAEITLSEPGHSTGFTHWQLFFFLFFSFFFLFFFFFFFFFG